MEGKGLHAHPTSRGPRAPGSHCSRPLGTDEAPRQRRHLLRTTLLQRESLGRALSSTGFALRLVRTAWLSGARLSKGLCV